jgi:hypothetical protein
MDVNTLVPELLTQAKEWILQQRSLYQKDSSSIHPADIERLNSYYTEQILRSVRIAYTDIIENPPFFDKLTESGITQLINFNDTAGITFNDCIVISRKFEHTPAEFTSLLFHELVHVVQYQILGIERFISEYINGWINNGFSYYKIPLEEQAFLLQSRFDRDHTSFSVLQEVSAKYLTNL